MKNDSLDQNPFLKKLMRTFDRGDSLFEQGDMGNTVFLILKGEVDLISKRDTETSLIGKVGSGEFIGEKALLQEKPFPRFCSATAAEEVLTLELGASQFSQLEKDAPSIFNVLLKKAFKTAVQRLDASNRLCNILKIFEPRKRFLNYIHFVFSSHGKSNLKGRTVLLSPFDISFHIGCTPEDAQDWLSTLCDLHVLIAEEESKYTIQDENTLLTVDTESLAFPEAA